MPISPETVIKDLAVGYPSREAWAKSFMGEEKYNDVVRRLTKFGLSFEDSGKVSIDFMDFPIVCTYYCRIGRAYDPVDVNSGQKVEKPIELIMKHSRKGNILAQS